MVKYTLVENQATVKGALVNGIIEIEFLKADGSKRKMNATLLESVVPPAKKDDPLTQKKVRAVNEEVQVVWDTDAKGWRSFRWDRLQGIKETS